MLGEIAAALVARPGLLRVAVDGVTGAGVVDGGAFLVMDLLEGADLEEVCGSDPQPPEVVVEWLRQVARGLARAHAMGLVHRDLKPQNLFLTERSLVKILDFGIVKHSDLEATPTVTGRMLGTPMYMAPEQAVIGDDPIGKSADLYALGLVAFRLLAGVTYRRGDTMVKLLSEVLSKDVVAPSARGLSLDADFDTWFAKSCAISPKDRFASAPEQIEALSSALGLPIQEPSTPPIPRPSRANVVVGGETFASAPTAVMGVPPKTGTSRRLMLVGGVAVAVAVAAILVLLSLCRQNNPQMPTSELDAAWPAALADGRKPGARDPDSRRLREIQFEIETAQPRVAGAAAMEELSLAAARPSEAAMWADTDTLRLLRAAYVGGAMPATTFAAKKKAWMTSWRARADDRMWRDDGPPGCSGSYSPHYGDLDSTEAKQGLR